MIDAAAINEILKVYSKHGWNLRRVLLSAALDESLKATSGDLFGDIGVSVAQIDAAWFSRPPKPGAVAWEIRHLSEIPFALLEYLDESDTDFESNLRAVETRLAEAVRTKKPA